MTRSILCGLLAVLSVGALGVVPVACQSGGVGDPCTPEDEYSATFAGFHTDLANIESRSFQCATRICLVNHFQGRVSCPLGQDATPMTGTIQQCNPMNNGSDCATGKKCTAADVFAPTCTTQADCPTGLGLICEKGSGTCQCTQSAVLNSINYYCEQASPSCTGQGCPRVLQSYFCHETGQCQLAGATEKANGGKDCCIPGSDTPVGVTVCGQCGAASKRNAADAVYCSCRCCAPCCPAKTTDKMANQMGCSNDMSTCGSACDPNFNYCSCPSGYTCTNIREYVGLGDQNLAGAYCVTSGTAWDQNVPCMADPAAFVNDTSCAQ